MQAMSNLSRERSGSRAIHFDIWSAARKEDGSEKTD